MATGEVVVDDVRAHDVWARKKDGTVVFVELVVDSWDEAEGRVVSWVAIPSGRTNICTERWFVRSYSILARQA